VNTGSNTLVASFVLSYPQHGMTLIESRVDVAVAGGVVPDWWRFKLAGSCRATSLGVSSAIPAPGNACVDWAGGVALDSFVSYEFFPLIPGRLGVTFTSQVPAAQSAELVPGQEYFAYAVTLDHQKTVGTGACTGCNLGACMGLQYVELHNANGGYITIYPFGGNTAWQATWQGGGVPGCAFTLPTKTSTWGAVKSLYR
jgi:hypothetical protein